MEQTLKNICNLPLSSLKGIDQKRAKLFEKLMGKRAVDALYHLPTNLISRRRISFITEAKEAEIITIMATIVDHHLAKRKGGPTKISCFDGKNYFDAVYFKGSFAYQKKLLPLHSKRVLSGKVEKSSQSWQIHHPEIGTTEFTPSSHQIEPVYGLTAGITNRCVNRVIQGILPILPQMDEWLSPSIKANFSWPNWHDALKSCHSPQSSADLLASSPFRERLAYDELLAHQLSLNLLKINQDKIHLGHRLIGTNILINKILKLLPYTLTSGQENVLNDIYDDMASPTPMLRLLQGDVGSGKTIIAVLAMIRAIESGYQAAILAPTDILARQHAETIIPLMEQVGVRCQLLTGRDKGKKRTQLLEKLKNHQIDILIGTHAIIQEDVFFGKLGLAIIDEQHRFGVEQRLALSEKGNNPDILTMTATPIPRTLALANYGDMDVSILKEKPAGRQPIATKVLSLEKLDDVIKGIERTLNTKTKIFWICPLIEESEALDLAAAQERYIDLKACFGTQRVGLVHGRMKAADKDAVMEGFINGEIDLLVSTTVVEVGVNVPQASVMVIEHAERFGLAQLHQLRGRIGRGNQQATCLLLYGFPLSSIGRKRLEIMRESNDGFRLAEEDLKLRGGGDVLGTRQSGLPQFRLADFTSHPDRSQELLAIANKEAREICRDDPKLTSPRGQALRALLNIFGRDNALRYSRS